MRNWPGGSQTTAAKPQPDTCGRARSPEHSFPSHEVGEERGAGQSRGSLGTPAQGARAPPHLEAQPGPPDSLLPSVGQPGSPDRTEKWTSQGEDLCPCRKCEGQYPYKFSPSNTIWRPGVVESSKGGKARGVPFDTRAGFLSSWGKRIREQAQPGAGTPLHPPYEDLGSNRSRNADWVLLWLAAACSC